MQKHIVHTLLLFILVTGAQTARADVADTVAPPCCPFLCSCYSETPPMFPGGDSALLMFLTKNIEMPAPLTDSSFHFRVVTRFTVNEDGSVSNPAILKSADPAFDREVLRVIALMPRFIPGKQNGKPAAFQFALPVIFSNQ